MTTTESHSAPQEWVPQACTLPTAERPLRVEEFDDLFGSAVRELEHAEPTRLRLGLVPSAEVAARTAQLAAQETACCSFFTFTLVMTGGELSLDVAVPDVHVAVLTALAARAGAALSGPAG